MKEQIEEVEENALEQHRWIIADTSLSLEEKTAQLFNLCEHLYHVLDEYPDGHRDLCFVESLMRRMNKKGYFLKLDQNKDGFKATFWKPDGDGVKAYSGTNKDWIEAISSAGTKPELEKVWAMIQASKEVQK